VSLYGSGRREGIGTVVVIGALAVFVQALGGVQAFGFENDWIASADAAVVPALGGALCYRLLKALGRSRYAAFLTGLAYALSPWLLSMAIEPREQFAAALAPAALEAVVRCRHPVRRISWMPWAGLGIGLPFVAGFTVVGWLGAGLCALLFVPVVRGGKEEKDKYIGLRVACAVLLAAASAASFAGLDLCGNWTMGPAANAGDVLGAHHPGRSGIDFAGVLRVPGAFLLFFAFLGFLRRQRHANTLGWLLIAVAAAVPTVLVTMTEPPTWICKEWRDIDPVPAAAWWLCLLAACVLGASGLDDFLDLPLRRRTAVAWLLALVVAVAPTIALNSDTPELEWPQTATLLALGVLLPLWRRLGILRWKAVLALTAVTAVAIPALQVLPCPEPWPFLSTPWGEITLRGPVRNPWSGGAPIWPYAGLAGVLACSVAWYLFAIVRRIKERPTPTAAKAAIVKKTRPAQRS
jgi:hypothetical protein